MRIALAAFALTLLGGCALLRPVARPPIYPVRTSPSGVIVQDLVVPEEGPVAGPGSHVSLHYALWLGVGDLVDSSFDRGLPIEFAMGTGLVPSGLEEGIIGMRRGGLRALVVPPELGYGAEGLAGVVPPDCTLVFHVELIEVD